MADWQGGKLAVAAVPGAGKSTGMAVTAALVDYQDVRLQLMLDLGALTSEAPKFWLKDHVPAFLPGARRGQAGSRGCSRAGPAAGRPAGRPGGRADGRAG